MKTSSVRKVGKRRRKTEKRRDTNIALCVLGIIGSDTPTEEEEEEEKEEEKEEDKEENEEVEEEE